MYRLVGSCKKSTELIDKKFILSLSVKESVQLYFHKTICKTCRSYENQSKFIDQAISTLFDRVPRITSKSSTKRKQQLIRAINKS